MKNTLFGRAIELSTEVPEGVIRMHPETWWAVLRLHMLRSAKVDVLNTPMVTEEE